MTRPKARQRTRACGEAEARKRLRDAEKYFEVAELVAGEPDAESVSVAAGLTVLAGIAASDAASCRALGVSSRSVDHRDAAALLRGVTPGGDTAARDLERLIAIKDAAHYGFINVSASDRKAALRRAGALISFARSVLER